MNRIKYIILAAVAILGIACQKEQVITETDNSGYVDLKVAVASQTRATEFVPDNVRVRIYDAENRLIRVYTSLEDLEAHNPLALVAGEYTVKVEGGDKSRPAFTESSVAADTDIKKLLYYTGEAPMTVKAGETADITVNCMANNVKMDVAIAAKADGNENDKLSDIVISMAEMELTSSITNQATFNTAAKDLNKVTFGSASAGFTGSDTAYLLLEDVDAETVKSKIAWSLVGKHTKGSTVVDIDKVGEIVVEPGKAYKINYTFSKAADGTMTVTITVDQTAEGYDNEFAFKPQPEFGFPDGSSWSATGTNTYVAGTEVTFACESSVSELATLSYKIGNEETQIWSNDATRSGEDVRNYFEVTPSEDNKTLTIKAKQKFFELFAGGKQEFAFKAVDEDGGDATYDVTFNNQGLLIDGTAADLWANTAKFEGVVTAKNSSSVKVQFRKKGSTDGWATTGEGTISGTSVTEMTSTAAWTESKNVNSHTIYTPNTDKSIFANNTYECQLVVDGVPYGPIVEFTTGEGQTIPGGDFENNYSCFKDGKESSIWGSGNNTWATLCTRDTQTGNGRAKLTAARPMSMLAAGNLFTGTFAFGDPSYGLGTVRFGVPYEWKARPRALSVKYWADIQTVNMEGHKKELEINDPDQGSIYVCIIDWENQHGVVSGTSKYSGVWSPEDGMNPKDSEGNSVGKIIGYAVFYPQGTTSEDSSQMVKKELDIVYYDKDAKPAEGNYSLIIAAATSRYGDYMNGCSGNVMYVDDFQWVY